MLYGARCSLWRLPSFLRNRCVEEELNGRLSGAFADIAVLAVQRSESSFACFAKSTQTRAP